MGDTVIKDADKLSPYEVGGLTTLLGSKGLDNHVKIKGKSVGKRMDHRKYYDLARRNESSNINKTSDMVKKTTKQSSLVNNNEKIMNKQVKEAFVKLATIKLAINYVLRNRLMSKQAAPGGFGPTSHNPTMNMGYVGRAPAAPGLVGGSIPDNRPFSVGGYTIDPSMNRTQNPAGFSMNSFNSSAPAPNFSARQAPVQTRRQQTADLKKRLGLSGPNITWNKDNSTYDLGGRRPEEARQALEEERARIEGAWNQLNEAERMRYGRYYDRHMSDISRQLGDIENQQAYAEQPTKPNKPAFDNRVDNTYDGAGKEMSGVAYNGYAENPDGSGWKPASGSAPFVPKDMPTLEPIQYAGPTPADPRVVPNDPRYQSPVYNGFAYRDPSNVHSILDWQ